MPLLILQRVTWQMDTQNRIQSAFLMVRMTFLMWGLHGHEHHVTIRPQCQAIGMRGQWHSVKHLVAVRVYDDQSAGPVRVLAGDAAIGRIYFCAGFVED